MHVPVCVSLLLSVKAVYSCVTEDFFYPCLLLHQHCPRFNLVLSSRTLSLPAVLWSYGSQHYLLYGGEERASVGRNKVLSRTHQRGFYSLSHPSFTHNILHFLSSSSFLKCASFLLLLALVFVCDFFTSPLSPLGQGASWDHPTGESQHQGGGGAQETCECRLIRALIFSPPLPWLLDTYILSLLQTALCLFPRTALNSITLITKAKLSKPARRRQMGGLWKATMWCTEYQLPRQKRRRSGLNPSSKTPHKHTQNKDMLFGHSLCNHKTRWLTGNLCIVQSKPYFLVFEALRYHKILTLLINQL